MLVAMLEKARDVGGSYCGLTAESESRFKSDKAFDSSPIWADLCIALEATKAQVRETKLVALRVFEAKFEGDSALNIRPQSSAENSTMINSMSSTGKGIMLLVKMSAF